MFKDFGKIVSKIEKINKIAGNVKSSGMGKTYVQLTLDEIKELFDASVKRDLVEVVDAQCDHLVTGIFGLLCLGKTYEEINDLINTPCHRLAWSINESLVFSEVFSSGTDERLTFFEDIVTSTVKEMRTFKTLDVDYEECLNTVIDNVLTKFPLKGSVDPAKEVVRLKAQGRYKEPFYKEVDVDGQTFYVFLSHEDLKEGIVYDNPKFLKPSSYREESFQEHMGFMNPDKSGFKTLSGKPFNELKILVVGHKQHGKDTVAQMLSAVTGMTYNSSSKFVIKEFLLEEMSEKFGYISVDECFEKRDNHRKYLYERICELNTPDKSLVQEKSLSESCMYVGLRDKDELQSALEKDLYDLVIFVDASMRKPLESPESMNIKVSDLPFDHYKVNNNFDKRRLVEECAKLANFLKYNF